jgi:O-antigen/teichoic acid export membrane protein
MNGKVILGNAFSLFVSNVLVRLVNAVAAILIARYLGAHDYGILSVALAFSSIAANFTDLGLTHTLIREGTKPQANLAVLISSFLRIRVVLALLTAIVSIVLIENLYTDAYLQTVLYWLVLPTLFGAALQGVGYVYFQVTQTMKYSAIISGVSGLITSLTLILGMIFHWPLIFLAAVYGFSSFAGGLIAIIMVARKTTFHKGWNPQILQGILAFTLGGFAVMLLPQLGPLVLEKVTDLTQVGYFSAAYRIPAVLYQVPGIIATAFYPLLFQYGNEKRLEDHLSLGVIQLKLMNALGILMALPFVFYAEWWMTLLLGPNWGPAAKVLSILGWMVVLQSMNFPLADALTTKGLQPRRTLVLGIAAIAGLIFYAFLGQRFGAIGGAFSAIFTEGVLSLGFILLNPTGLSLLTRGIRYNLIALAIVVVLTLLVRNALHPFLSIPFMELIFLGIVLGLDRDLQKRALGLLAQLKAQWLRRKPA